MYGSKKGNSSRVPLPHGELAVPVVLHVVAEGGAVHVHLAEALALLLAAEVPQPAALLVVHEPPHLHHLPQTLRPRLQHREVAL